MRITRVSAYRQLQPFREGTYRCSGGRSATGFDSTIVRLDTDAGLVGWGEMAPLGAFYDPAFAAGARSAMTELADLLIGHDPTQMVAVGQAMDLHLNGHPYAKSAIDMACWDLFGRVAGMPLAECLGGRFGESVALYRSVSQDTPERMAKVACDFVAAGYRRLQVKVGLDPHDDIARLHAVRDAVGADMPLFADANGGWTRLQAREFLRGTRDLAYSLEQPCATYVECRALRDACDRPLVLDESIDGLAALLRAQADGVADAITVKIARVGGVTKARLIRDVAVSLGVEVTVEDTGGSDIDTAAMLHLSLSTPEPLRLHTVDFNNWVTVRNADGIPPPCDGGLGIGAAPGLGITVRADKLGQPFLSRGA